MTELAPTLRAAMAAMGWNIRQTAENSGVDAQTISNLLRGLEQARPSTAGKLADALHEPELLKMVVANRRRQCPVCKQRFTTTHTSLTRARYCSKRCQQTAWLRQRARGRATTERAARYRMADYQKAIAKFCERCSEDYCPDAQCELRPYSPLPLIQLKRRAA